MGVWEDTGGNGGGKGWYGYKYSILVYGILKLKSIAYSKYII